MGINCLNQLRNVCFFCMWQNWVLYHGDERFCAGLDLEKLGPYRLSYRQEGFFGVADPLRQSDREQHSE